MGWIKEMLCEMVFTRRCGFAVEALHRAIEEYMAVFSTRGILLGFNLRTDARDRLTFLYIQKGNNTEVYHTQRKRIQGGVVAQAKYHGKRDRIPNKATFAQEDEGYSNMFDARSMEYNSWRREVEFPHWV